MDEKLINQLKKVELEIDNLQFTLKQLFYNSFSKFKKNT